MHYARRAQLCTAENELAHPEECKLTTRSDSSSSLGVSVHTSGSTPQEPNDRKRQQYFTFIVPTLVFFFAGLKLKQISRCFTSAGVLLNSAGPGKMRAAVNSVAQRPVAAVFPSPDRSRLVSSLVFQQASPVDSRSRCVRAAASDADPERIGLQKDDGEEATFAPLDASSSGGLGGTTNDVFGPLVCFP